LIFLELQPQDDYVLIVDLGAGLRDRSIYVVPTSVIAETLETGHTHYVSFPKSDGNPRKAEQGMRTLHFHGEDRPGNIGYGFDKKFEEYREAWTLLK